MNSRKQKKMQRVQKDSDSLTSKKVHYAPLDVNTHLSEEDVYNKE